MGWFTRETWAGSQGQLAGSAAFGMGGPLPGYIDAAQPQLDAGSASATGSSTALNSRLGRHFDGRSLQWKGRLYEQHAVMPDNAADRPIDCLHQHESGLS